MARVTLVLFVGILIAQVFGTWLWISQLKASEHNRLIEVSQTMGSRIGQTVQFFKKLPDQYRHIVLDQLRDMGGTRFFVSVNEQHIALQTIPQTEFSQLVREQMSSSIVAQMGQARGLDIQFVDFDDLKKKTEEYSKNLAALMVTYPSTHGVFEEKITEICELIHSNGGQVYMDGANLNALVGIAKPGNFGPDVCHINLHKTFCIPHGGGGPGMGPIACGKHLAEFLPTHGVIKESGPKNGMGAVSAAPWGSSSILPISWMYIKMMGAEGLKKASQISILNANYISKKLSKDFKVLYTGKNGNVAHECIIDIRPIKASSGISEEDLAKRLIDFGYHAPTMSWPVAGTIMIEPTESENLEEIDKFCNALIKIKKEIDLVETGKFDKEDNPLKNAPHTYLELAANEWSHKYTREEAAFPNEYVRHNKYWAPVARVDNVYGDRNLVCSCPSMDEYKDEAA